MDMSPTHPICAIDHVAITVADLTDAIAFYREALGAEVAQEYQIEGRVMVVQLRIGAAMLNIHQAGHSHPLVASRPTPGAVDLCFRWQARIESAIAHLQRTGVEIIEGPVERQASDGRIGRSVYFRDRDGNLLEFLSTVPANL